MYTEYRPTPLQHFIFPAGAEGLFMVVDERGTFRQAAARFPLSTLSGSHM